MMHQPSDLVGIGNRSASSSAILPNVALVASNRVQRRSNDDAVGEDNRI